MTINLTPHPWFLATYIVLFLKPYFKATEDLQNAWIFVILLSPYIMYLYIDLSKQLRKLPLFPTRKKEEEKTTTSIPKWQFPPC